MLEVLIGVGGFVVGYGVNWCIYQNLRAKADKRAALIESSYRNLYNNIVDEGISQAERYNRVADSQSVAIEKIRAIREMIDGTTRVRSSRIREVLGE